MAGIQVQGASGSVVEAGAFAAKGLHYIAKNQDYGALGQYQGVFTTGTIAVGMAANGALFTARWVDTTRFCLIHEVQVLEFRNITTAFAAGPYQFNVIRATAWSVDPSGGAAIGVADPQLQLRAATMGATLFSTGLRIATTAALTQGTLTLDTVPMGACFGIINATPVIAAMYIPNQNTSAAGGAAGGGGVTLFKADIANGEHPIVLTSPSAATSEGILIRATVPATGTWIASFLVKWSEVTAF